jgi:hypothetical protein
MMLSRLVKDSFLFNVVIVMEETHGTGFFTLLLFIVRLNYQMFTILLIVQRIGMVLIRLLTSG